MDATSMLFQRHGWDIHAVSAEPAQLIFIAQPLDDGDAEGQSVFTAARKFCPAVLTWPRADTAPDTVLTPGLARRLLTAVPSVFSEALSALVWVCHRPCALLTSVVRAVLTLLTSEVISLTAPGWTLTCLSWSSAVRTAAASAHRVELAGEAAADDEVAGAAAEGELPDVALPDEHPASSARPHAARTSLRRAGPATIPGFMSRPGSRAAGRPRFTRGGLC